MSTAKNEARINVRLSSELKRTIEEAATLLGQSVSEFMVSTMVRESRQVIEEANVTRLSDRDRDLFLEALENAEPNEKLKAAAQRYNEWIAKSE